MDDLFDSFKQYVLPTGSDTFTETRSEAIINPEKSFEEFSLASEIIGETLPLNTDQNDEKMTGPSESSSSSFRLKDPPDLNEILTVDEALISPTSHNVGILNNACQQVLKEMEFQLLKLLKQNRKEQETVSEFLESNGKILNPDNSKKVNIKCVGIPYFKDFDGFFPPNNEDVLQKKKSQKLLPIDFIEISPAWNSFDSKNLIKAVNKTVQSLKLSHPVNPDSVDWMKVSATDMEGKYSPVECKSKWMLHLRPEINKSKWGLKEMKSLETLANKYKFQDWDEIAKELGTNRSGLQCCVQYQSHRARNGGKWTPEEDETLKKLIEKYKVKDYIPWPKVSWHFEQRSLRQCQERYAYHLGNIKKGNFSVEEDFVLVYLASKLKNFGEVAKYLPKRVSTQVRARYEYLVNISMPDFTKEEDELLTNLVYQYPRKWAKISEFFTNRSKLQCRRRWAVLQKQIKLKKEMFSDSETEEITSATDMINDQTRNDTIVDAETISKNLGKVSRVKKANLTSTTKHCSKDYSVLLDYHKNCHKFLFGPRIKLPSDSEESEKVSKKMKIIFTHLSVSFLEPLKTFNLNSLGSNSEFESEDLLLLERVKRATAEQEEEESKVKLSDKIIPPNYMNLVGFRTLTLSWGKIRNLCSFYQPREDERLVETDPEKRLLFSDAKKLFKARMKALFLFPIIMSFISQENIDFKPVRKPKARKPFKKISKLRRKEHAKLMSQTYQLKRKLNEKLSVSGNANIVETENTSLPEKPTKKVNQMEVLTEEKKKSNSSAEQKRKKVRSPTVSENSEEPETKRLRRRSSRTNK